MAQNELFSIEELSENINTTLENLKTLEESAENNPESSKLVSYLRVAIASLCTAAHVAEKST
jgi:hypothetical protein